MEKVSKEINEINGAKNVTVVDWKELGSIKRIQWKA